MQHHKTYIYPPLPPKNKFMQLCYLFNSIKTKQRVLEGGWLSLSSLILGCYLFICLFILIIHQIVNRYYIFLGGGSFMGQTLSRQMVGFKSLGKTSLCEKKIKIDKSSRLFLHQKESSIGGIAACVTCQYRRSIWEQEYFPQTPKLMQLRQPFSCPDRDLSKGWASVLKYFSSFILR